MEAIGILICMIILTIAVEIHSPSNIKYRKDGTPYKYK